MHNDFNRYHCQMALPGFGVEAQRLLQKAKVLIVGSGGLGCPAAQYMAAAGVGTLAIADDDIISVSNLHRQVLFTPDDIGLKKVVIACRKLQSQNPDIDIIPYDVRITSDNVMDILSEFDLVIEGTDNFETKYLLNDACVLAGKPLIYGAIYQYEGQVAVWNAQQKDGTYSPHYRDVFPDAENARVPNCAEGGVIPTLAGIVGCMQANEALKYFTQPENLLAGKLWMINVQNGETRIIHLGKASQTKINKLPEAIQTISFEELQEGMKQHVYELIDVRNEAAHQAYNIGGINIPLEELDTYFKNHSFSKPVVLYCAGGKRSAMAVKKIKTKFHEAKVLSLKGGIGLMKN